MGGGGRQGGGGRCGGATSSESGKGWRGWPAGAACCWGASAQNQLPGGHELGVEPAGADCAIAASGTASANASAVADRRDFVMAGDSFRSKERPKATLRVQSRCHQAWLGQRQNQWLQIVRCQAFTCHR